MAGDSSSISSVAAATTTTIMTSNAAAAASAASAATAIATTTAAAVPVTGTIQASSAKPQFIQQQRPNLPPFQAQNLPPSARPQTHPQSQIQSLPPLRYPLASSGRGFVNSSSSPRPQVQSVTVSNPNPNPASYPVLSRSTIGYPPPSRPSGFAPSPPPLVKGFPVTAQPHHFKVGSSVCSMPDCSGGHKASSDSVKDEVCVSVLDRKVRISNGASIYALCRSWLRNGHPEEVQPQFADIAKSLPMPAPAPAPSLDNSSPKGNSSDEEEEHDIDEKAAESMSSEELLKLHVKRAKRVRERLRKERMKRIARYKGRLALLLPPFEQCRNDPSDAGGLQS